MISFSKKHIYKAVFACATFALVASCSGQETSDKRTATVQGSVDAVSFDLRGKSDKQCKSECKDAVKALKQLRKERDKGYRAELKATKSIMDKKQRRAARKSIRQERKADHRAIHKRIKEIKKICRNGGHPTPPDDGGGDGGAGDVPTAAECAADPTLPGCNSDGGGIGDGPTAEECALDPNQPGCEGDAPPPL